MRVHLSALSVLGLTAAFALSACSGSQTGSAPAVPNNPETGNVLNVAPQSLALKPSATTATPSPPPSNGQDLQTRGGHLDKVTGKYVQPVINGKDMQFTPPVADTPTGGHGPANTTLDGVGCQVSMSRNYHIHVFVGLYVNGVEYAIPRGVGVAEPKNPNALEIDYATKCFYYTHTHNSTGILHIEDYNNGVVEKPPVTSHYTIGQWFAVWGITVSPTQFGQFTGPVQVFTTGQLYRPISPTQGGVIGERLLSYYSGDPNSIALYDHEVIWFLVGPTYPTSLPSIDFYAGY